MRKNVYEMEIYCDICGKGPLNDVFFVDQDSECSCEECTRKFVTEIENITDEEDVENINLDEYALSDVIMRHMCHNEAVDYILGL